MLAGLKALVTAEASDFERWSGAPAFLASWLILEVAAGAGAFLGPEVRAGLEAVERARLGELGRRLVGRAGAFLAGAGRLTLRAAISAHRP
ncbi:MAG: hypothetical protein KC910_16500 [Candidatus Eremiobacteraeota bacterium]|nr:hypothetical protein [Candidatus Eremiobacteraeota bacterium]